MILEGNLITRIILNQVFNFDQQFHGLEFYHFLPITVNQNLFKTYLDVDLSHLRYGFQTFLNCWPTLLISINRGLVP